MIEKHIRHEDGVKKHIGMANCYVGEGRHELMPEVVGEVEEVRFMEGEAGCGID